MGGGRGAGEAAEPLGPLTPAGGPGEGEGGDGSAKPGYGRARRAGGGAARSPAAPRRAAPRLGSTAPQAGTAWRAIPPRRGARAHRPGPPLLPAGEVAEPGPAPRSGRPPRCPRPRTPRGSPNSSRRRRRGRQDALSPRCPMLAGLRGCLSLREGGHRRTHTLASPRPRTGGRTLLGRPLCLPLPCEHTEPPARPDRPRRAAQPTTETNFPQRPPPRASARR